MRPMLRTALLLATAPTLLAAFPRNGSATRWGPLGHHVVAEVALARLEPRVAAETRHLLGGENITDVSSWADDIRRAQPETAPWHYVDIEIIDSSYVPSRDCKKDACIVAALGAQTAILGDATRPDSERAVALKWIVHLVGDIHQPLHAGERGDRGGNDVKVTFEGRQTNLHALWDSGLLTSYGQSDDELVHAILAEIGRRKDIAALSEGTPVEWAVESHDIARDMVYRLLPNSLVIDQAYADAARPVIQERLLRGGIRLAALLNRVLGH